MDDNCGQAQQLSDCSIPQLIKGHSVEGVEGGYGGIGSLRLSGEGGVGTRSIGVGGIGSLRLLGEGGGGTGGSSDPF